MRSDALRISSLCHLNAMSGPFASGSFLLAHGPWSLVSTTCARGVSAHTHVCAWKFHKRVRVRRRRDCARTGRVTDD
jgi:hypothetical protein